ncbi:MAG: hypothetical protein R2793_09430 [Flavobacteriaceae bacterium]
MKNLFLKTLLIASFFLFIACSKDDEGKSTTLIFTPSLSISNSETLTYDLGNFGDKNLTSILSQAKNAELSELRIDETTGKVYYFYQPKAGFIGHDFIQLITETGPLGSPDSTIAMQANITIEISF